MSAPWRIGVWCAVSSKPQADPQKDSLPEQEQAGLEFARAVGGEVVRVYSVPGHSRDYWNWFDAERDIPAYRELREDLEAGRLDVVHCVDSDRLGRDAALVQQFYSLAERHGCEVYDASMPHPLGQQHTGHRYGVAVKGVAADEDQRRRIMRHAMGVKGRVRRGLAPLSRWPLGYSAIRDGLGRCVGAEFTPDIGAVDLVVSLFLEGRSYDSIMREMWRSGYALPSGRPWHINSVWRIVHNDAYAGFVHWGGTRNEQPSTRFPARWDGRTYAAILREREARASGWVHPHGGPLAGIAFCGRCDHHMGRLSTKHPGEWYLRCTWHATASRRPDRSGCHPNYILEADVLAVLSAWLAELATPDRLDAALRANTQPEPEQEQGRLAARLEDLERRRRRLALALAAGDMEPGIYRETDRTLQDECAACQGRLTELHTLIASRPSIEERRAHIEALISRLSDANGLGTDAHFSAALRLAGVRVYCEDRKVSLIGFVA